MSSPYLRVSRIHAGDCGTATSHPYSDRPLRATLPCCTNAHAKCPPIKPPQDRHHVSVVEKVHLSPRWAGQHSIRYSKRPRPCCRHVSRMLRTRSTNRLPRLLSVPPLPFRQRTACRNARSAALFVGSMPSCHTNAHSFGSLAIKLRHVAAVLGQPQPAPLSQCLIDLSP
jgi:hypothetical protein